MDGENNGKPYFLMDDLEVPLFLETSISIHPCIHPKTPVSLVDVPSPQPPPPPGGSRGAEPGTQKV